jgi:hypothetical protein
MYGIPLAIDFDIGAERTAACNVSRTVVAAVRKRYADYVRDISGLVRPKRFELLTPQIRRLLRVVVFEGVFRKRCCFRGCSIIKQFHFATVVLIHFQSGLSSTTGALYAARSYAIVSTCSQATPKVSRWPQPTTRSNGHVTCRSRTTELPEVLVASGQHLASVLQEGRGNANIDAGLGFIW